MFILIKKEFETINRLKFELFSAFSEWYTAFFSKSKQIYLLNKKETA